MTLRIAVIMLLASTTAILPATIVPALADQAAADRYIAEQWAKIGAMQADNAKRDANQKALCARVGSVRIGLSPDGVLKSCWGKPTKINTTLTADHKTEQWVYGSGHYVYLTDGFVTAIQASR
jgi:hypothetical protein